MRWRSWSPKGAGHSCGEPERAIKELVGLVAAGEFDPADVRVEWWMDGRWVLAPRATFRARKRGRDARRRRGREIGGDAPRPGTGIGAVRRTVALVGRSRRSITARCGSPGLLRRDDHDDGHCVRLLATRC